jgi:hypothetical protein
MAQRGFPGGHFGAGFSGRFASNQGSRYARSGGYPFGSLFWDSLYPDDYFTPQYPAAPPVILIQQPPAPRAEDIPAPQPASPLLIERRGDHYVRITDAQDQPADSGTVGRSSPSYAAQASSPVAKPAETILIFRDGSREQISGYTITEGTLYAQTNYYVDGSWNKKILVSSLDIPATLNANKAHGVKFQLPDAPNQVIVGP